MSYVEKTLTAEERIIIFERLHWIAFMYPLLLSLILLSQVFSVFTSNWILIEKWKTCFAGVLLILTAIILLKAFIRYFTTENAVTNKKVIFKTGFIKTQTNELRKEKIENIQIRQSIIGKILSYGDLTFIGTGGSPVVFQSINRPIAVKKKIESALFR